MQPVSNTLEAMKLNAASPKDAPLGLTTTDLTVALQPRPKALSEMELTRIASSVLQRSPMLCCEKKKIYETKRDANGAEFEAVVGEEDCVDVEVFVNVNAPRTAFEAALRMSPASAVNAHLTRLSLHKRLGSNDKDRAILLHDYASSLARFPEFVVFIACKAFWENTATPWFPKIAEIAKICDAIKILFSRAHTTGSLEPPRAPIKPKAMREEDSPGGKSRREHLVAFIKANAPDGGARALEFMRADYPSNYSLEGTARSCGWQGWPKDFDHAG